MSQRDEDETNLIAGLRRALAIVDRQIINADHHQEIRGLNRARDALFDEIEAMKTAQSAE